MTGTFVTDGVPDAVARAKDAAGEKNGAALRSRLGPRLPEGDLGRVGRGDHAAPARRALARLEQHGCAELARLVGDVLDSVDLDIGQPQRAPRAALDDAAAEATAEVQPEV